MLPRYVSRSWLLALAASATLGVVSAGLRGEEPPAPQGKQTPAPDRLPSIAPVPAVASSPSEEGGEWIPENLRDPAFDRYVDLALLCQAWDDEDASALADVALQLREGERILMRPRRGFSSQQLLLEAARIAAETNEKDALQRLGKIAETLGSAELKVKVAGAEKLAGQSRATDPALQVSIAEMTPEDFAELWECWHEIQDASLTGDTVTLKEIQDELADNSSIPEKQKKYLQKLLQEGQAAAAAMPESQKQLNQSLGKLSDSSRKGGGGGKGGGGKKGGGKKGGGKKGGGGPHHDAHHDPHHGPHGVYASHDHGHFHGHHHGGYFDNGVWVDGGDGVVGVDGAYGAYDVGVAGGGVAAAQTARTGGLWFENLTDRRSTVAIAYYDANAGPTWTVTGWYAVEPSQRVCAVSGDLANRNYFYYAVSAKQKWEGDSNSYYVNPQHAFSYDSQDPAAVSDVKQQGFENHGFNKIDTGGALYYLVQLQ